MGDDATAWTPDVPAAVDEHVRARGDLRLALRRRRGPRRPFLLVHGLSSNARLWDQVSQRLAVAGHEVAAVDLRGHGRSDAPEGGYTTPDAAADLAGLIQALGWHGSRAPLVAGQSWGGNVVVDLAADHGLVAGLALVDGGWIRLGQRYADFEQCWAELAPPRLDGVAAEGLMERIRAAAATWPAESVEGALASWDVGLDGSARPRLDRRHHRAILRSLWERDPWDSYPRVAAPAVLLAAVPPPAAGAGLRAGDDSRVAVREAARRLPDAQIRWYEGAHHDLHAEQPARAAGDLLELAGRVDPLPAAFAPGRPR